MSARFVGTSCSILSSGNARSAMAVAMMPGATFCYHPVLDAPAADPRERRGQSAAVGALPQKVLRELERTCNALT